MKVELHRINNACHFEARNEEGISMHLDSSAASMGAGEGIRPMQSLLMALGGCTAIDVTLILTKQKLVIDDFKIIVEGHREEGKEVALWDKIHISYYLTGELDQGKVERATELSMAKYCSVAETLRRAGAVITHEIHLNEEEFMV